MSDAVLWTYFDGEMSEIKNKKIGLLSHHSRWTNQASGVSSVLVCTDSPCTLLAHLTRFVRSTKSSRFALTLGVLSVNTQLYSLLIWESDMEKSLLSQSLCSEHFEKVGYWFRQHLSSRITFATLRAAYTPLQTVAVQGVRPVITLHTLPLLSCRGAGRLQTCS